VISIITVVRNNVDKIAATLESVLAQKGPDVEYIVIDGASTDGTLDVMRTYASRLDVFLSESDSGIYQALNKGIGRAKGSIIGLVHSGDILLPGVLAKVAFEHQKTPDAILYGCIKAMRHGKFESVWGWNSDSLPRQMLPHPACFVPKNVYDRYGGYDESYRIAGDYDAFLRYYQQKVGFRFIDLIIQEFDINGISQTQSSKAEIERIWKEHGIYRRQSLEQKVRPLMSSLARKALRGVDLMLGR